MRGSSTEGAGPVEEPGGDRPRRRATVPLVVAWAIFATYFAAARGVHNFFPFSVFDMYQGRPPDVVARIVVVDEGGATSELTGWESFRCDPERPSLTGGEHCGRPEMAIEYVARDQQRHLDAHLGEGGPASIAIVSRSYVLSPDPGEPSHTDCVIARCTARRVGAAP